MKRFLLLIGVLDLGGLGAAVVASGSSHHSVGRSTSFTTIDNAPKGPSIGDAFVFTDDLYANGKKVGRDQGSCFSTLREKKECSGSIIPKDGRIAFESAFTEGDRTIANAVAGGTGAYADARGTSTIKVGAKGTTVVTIVLR